MKKLIPFVMPLLIAAFLNLTINHAHAVSTGKAVIEYSTDLNNWAEVGDITDYILNAQADGLTELHLEATIGEDGATMIEVSDTPIFEIQTHTVEISQTTGFFRMTSDTELISPISSTTIAPTLLAKPECALAGVIIAIMVLIVVGIIIYLLIKTCKKLLP